MKTMKKRIVVLLAVLLMLSAAACHKEEKFPEDGKFYIYYRSQNHWELYPVEGIVDLTLPTDTLISSVFTHMMSGADESDYTSALAAGIELNGFVLEDENLILNFPSLYNEIPPMEEVLMRAAIVSTFSQLDGISTVEIRVEGQPLARHDGTAVGRMKRSDFADVIGNGLNAYNKTNVTIYLANENGTMLKRSTIDIAYDNSQSLEQVVASMITAGTVDKEYGEPVFPAGTRIVSVVTKNNVCHVDLTDSFVNSTDSSLLPEVTIYALVNSLTELSGITSVQITVNGSSAVRYMDVIDLSQPLKCNLDLVETEDAE